MEVVLLAWPSEEERRRALAAEGVPRLLLVDADAPAPEVTDCIEDWIRMPDGQRDIDARRRGVAARAAQAGGRGVRLDTDGVLRSGDDWVSLPPVESRLMEALLANRGAVVSRESLTRAGWPSRVPGRNALDVHMVRLRRRLDALGLAISTVRSRGYMLEVGRAL